MSEAVAQHENMKPDREMKPVLDLLGKIDTIASQSESLRVRTPSENEKGKIYYRPFADNEKGIITFSIKTDKEPFSNKNNIDPSQIREVSISYDFPGEADSTNYQIIILTRNEEGSWTKRAATVPPDPKESRIPFPPERIIPRTQYLLITYLQSLRARVSNQH